MQGLWHRHPRAQLVVLASCGVLAVSFLAGLGFWQLQRAAMRTDLQAQIVAAESAPPVSLEGGASADTALAGRHVAFHGEWIRGDLIYLGNRAHAGQVGAYVLMPVRLTDGRVLVVNRGWVARDTSQFEHFASFATPAGAIALEGLAETDESRLFALGGAGEEKLGGVWQNFDRAAFEAATGLTVLPILVRQIGGADDGLARDWPDRGAPLQDLINRNHGYALQWFAMAATLAALLLYYGNRHVRSRSRR